MGAIDSSLNNTDSLVDIWRAAFNPFRISPLFIGGAASYDVS